MFVVLLDIGQIWYSACPAWACFAKVVGHCVPKGCTGNGTGKCTANGFSGPAGNGTGNGTFFYTAKFWGATGNGTFFYTAKSRGGGLTGKT